MTAMTELFYRDPYVREFTSKVTSCVKGEKGFEVMLEDTAFYPEGGGQPADHGTIDGAAVFDVRRTPAGIVHYCEKAFDDRGAGGRSRARLQRGDRRQR